MATVQKILDSELPTPTWAFRPSLAAPIRSDMTFSRPDQGDGADATVFDPTVEKFVAKGADVPRIQGTRQELLVEEEQQTNLVPSSSNFDVNGNAGGSNWYDTGNASGDITGVESVMDASSIDDDVQALEASATESYAEIRGDTGNSFGSGRAEAVWAILEQGTASESGLQIKDNGSSWDEGVDVLWSGGANGEPVAEGTDNAGDKYDQGVFPVFNNPLTYMGPNGGRLYVVWMVVNTSTPSGERRLAVRPDRNGNGDTTYIHHVQVEEHQPTNPIPTSGSAKTRGRDRVTVFENGRPDWWNDNQGSFVIEVIPYNVYQEAGWVGVLTSSSFDRDFIALGGSPPDYKVRYTDGANNSSSFGVVPPREVSTIGVSIKPTEVVQAVNGSIVNTGSHNGNLLDDINGQLFIGGSNFGSFGFISGSYRPQALTNDELKTLTA